MLFNNNVDNITALKLELYTNAFYMKRNELLYKILRFG